MDPTAQTQTPSITQTSNENPTITFRSPTGQTITAPLNQAPPQIQLLYQQLPQATAQTSSAQSGAVSAAAGAKTATVQAKVAASPIDLGTALKNGSVTSIKDALSKYSATMNPDDIFQQYLATNGMPQESPQQLQEMGISQKALGDIGTPGSFMDRYNTKNAVVGLRDLQDKWNKTSGASRLAGMLGLSPDVAAYNNAKTILGSHISSLIPGASSAQSTGKSFVDMLPDPSNLTEDVAGKVPAQFNSIEDQLLKTKGYSYTDLGLGAPAAVKDTSSGGGLLKGLLTTASNVGPDLKNNINALLDLPASAVSNAQAMEKGPGGINSPGGYNPLLRVLQSAGMTVAPEVGYVSNLNKDIGEPLKGGDVVGRIGQNIEQRPVSTVADLLPFLGLIGDGNAAMTDVISPEDVSALEKVGIKAPEVPTTAEEATVPNLKGNPIMDFLNPKGQVARGGNVRNAVIDQATKAGATINGDDIVADLEKSASTLKQGNLGQGDTIDQSIADAKAAFGGKKLTPQEAANAYAEADPGFTKTGTPKSSIQSNIDRNLRDVLGNRLQEAAPGWNESTTEMAKGYATAKSPVRSMAKRAGSVGLGIAGLDEIRHVLGL